ncbi:hypothetical protein QAD02_019420 [Eretmocerus hayati]|uniref:Uncharacterized protein n=1 Tax=Eretmocerus hayati TaxID=131215 RepID=A0ACC2PKN7_9HYME|nr:hypothetical protein QAD02_019420 [Eretmocerus hayati]
MQNNPISCCAQNDSHSILHFCSKRAYYWVFALLRIASNFIPQNGYIHPDEFFQYIEVASGDSFDIDVNKPWEFNVTFPVRNSLFPHMCVRIPYLILGSLSPHCEYYFGFSLKSPYYLVLFPRILMTVLSFICDYCLYKICLIFHEPYVNRLTIFASSYVMLVYSTRTFSNSVEMIFTSILLYHVSRCIEFSNKVVLQSDYLADKYYRATTGVERTKLYKLRMSLPPHSLNDCLLLATIAVCGMFNRPTFIAFAFIPIFFWLQRGLGSRSVGFLDFHIRIFMFVLCGVPMVLFLILYDSLYFGYLTAEEIGKFEISMNNFVVTPLNFLRYNVITDNLKNHGLHPRFLHFLINIPLLFNILGIIGILTFIKMLNSGLRGRWLELPKIQNIESLMMASFVVPVMLLSIFPHQEPRFIIPVLLPLVFLFTDSIKDPTSSAVKVADNDRTIPVKLNKKSTNQLINIWYFFNILFAVFYGFIHQGGVLPLTTHLSKELKAKPELTHIHYFSSHTYSLPTGLLHLRNTKKTYKSDSGHKYILAQDFHMNEMGTKNVESIYNRISLAILDYEETLEVKKIPYRLYYALPSSFYNEFIEYAANNHTSNLKINQIQSFYPHISMEKLPYLDVSKCCHAIESCIVSMINNMSDNILNCVKQFSLVLLQIEYIKER